MANIGTYLETSDTIFPDGYRRESLFRTSGDMLDPQSAKAGRIATLIEAVLHWRMKRAGRLALRDMSPEQLSDIGLTRAEANAEIRKSLFID